MKKIAVALILLYCFFMNNFVYAQTMRLEYDGEVHEYTGDVYKLVVNGKTLENLPLDPIIFNNRAVVPVREVFEALGATVVYSAENNTVRVNYGKNTVVLTIGMHTALVNGIRKTIPDGVGAKLIGKEGEFPKTMVPVRFISESIGLDVGYDGVNKIISVTETKPRPTANPTATPKPTRTPTPVRTASPSRSPSVDDEDEEYTTTRLTKIKYEIDDDDVVTIKITASSKISKISDAVKTATGVVYIDVFGAENGLPNKTEIYEGVVETVRVGQHEDYTRIAIDTDGVKKYSVALSSTKKTITFKLSGNRNADIDIPDEPTPTESPKPSTSPTPTGEPSEEITEMTYDSKKIVILDAGHGGIDPGAIGYQMTDEEMELYLEAVENEDSATISSMKHGTGEEWYEKDIALAVVHKIRDNLEREGIEVILTREGDTYPALDERPGLANEEGAVIFVSVHLNSTLSEVTAANGVEVYYSTQNNDNTLGITSKELAEEILDCVIDESDAYSRGVKSGNLLVNRKCMMPSALIEIGFINNPQEIERLIDEDYQDMLADGIAQGIINMHEDIKIPKNKER